MKINVKIIKDKDDEEIEDNLLQIETYGKIAIFARLTIGKLGKLNFKYYKSWEL